jgi:hypothetical protein
MPHEAACTPVVEQLEGRALLASMILSNGVLNVVLDNGRNNQIYIHNNDGGRSYTTELNGTRKLFEKSKVSAIRVTGGDRNDVIDISRTVSIPTTLIGNAGNDTIKGGSGADLIFAGAGNDTVYGRDGDDVIRGGAGSDRLFGGNGADRLYGDAGGNDSLFGEGGNDLLDAGGGIMNGGPGTDSGRNARSYVSVEKRNVAIPAPPAEPASSGNSNGGSIPAGGTTPIGQPTQPTQPSQPSQPSQPVNNDGRYNVYDGVNVNTSIDVSRLAPVVRELGMQRVRVMYSTSTWNNRSLNKWALQRAQAFKDAGFHVLISVLCKADASSVPKAHEVEGYFRWLVEQPGVRGAAHLWQIGNEVNHDPFFRGTLKEYVHNELKPAYTVLSSKGMKVVGAGPTWDVEAAKELVRHGYLDYVDYAAFHPYGSSPQQLADRAKGAAEAYRGKPTLFTEWNIRNTPNKTEWARKVKESRELLKHHGEGAYYFGLAVGNSMAGPGGLVHQDSRLTPQRAFYDVAHSWQFDRSTRGDLL